MIVKCDCGREQFIPGEHVDRGFLEVIGWLYSYTWMKWICPFCPHRKEDQVNRLADGIVKFQQRKMKERKRKKK
jgi:hypothetical protein